MKSLIKLILVILFFTSCTNGEGYKARISEQERTIEHLKQNNKKLKNQKDSLELLASKYQKSIEILKSVKGKCLTYTDPNSGWLSSYYFYKNNLFILDYGDHSAYIGSWQQENDSIIIEISKKSGKRGIGEPIRMAQGVSAVEFPDYKEYVPFCERYQEHIALDWNGISKKIFLNYINKTNEYCDEFCGYKNIESDEIIKKFDIVLNGDYAFASEKYLKPEDINNYSIDSLKIIRNEIYARYGYIFKSEDLKMYFSSKQWYKPSIENVDEYLTGIEENNIRLIKYAENH